MNEISIFGLDLAKSSFQVHGAAIDGTALVRKKLSRDKVLEFFANQPRCLVAIEACSGAHFWARQLIRLGYEVRLVPPVYVKPYVKRQKNDVADAEAIAEAACRANMRFVAVKSEAKQALGMVFRTRDLYVRQRTQTINALRGHLAEFGIVAPKGPVHIERLRCAVEGSAAQFPPEVLILAEDLFAQIATLEARIHTLDRRLRSLVPRDDTGARLTTIPGVGPVCAAALQAFAPPMEGFRNGRDFAAWLGLAPRQHSTGGKQRLGRISKMGQRDLRRLLISGAMAVVRWAARKGAPKHSWLGRMLERKHRMLIAVALANKTARIIWAIMTKGGVYRTPAVTQ